MNRTDRTILLGVAIAMMQCTVALAQDVAPRALFLGTSHYIDAIPVSKVDSLWLNSSRSTLFVSTADTVLARPLDTVTDLWFDALPDAASIAYSDEGVHIVNPFAHCGVTLTAEGCHVTVDNANTTQELTFALSGTASNGSLTYNGSYKTTLQLDGVNLTSNSGPALNILCGKRIALHLMKGTANYLADAAGDHKGALYCKGHLEVDKGGTLAVKGNAKHAIFTKEYLQLKNGTGTIDILGAVGDGIHAGQYFQMNGGTVTIANVGDDGIQAELTDNAEDEWNGQLIVNGGTLTISTTGDETDALKSDAAMMLTALKSTPVITLTATGKGGKGIKSKGTLTIGSPDQTEGPQLTVSTTGAQSGSSSGNSGGGGRPPRPGGGGGWNPGGSMSSSGSSSKAIKAQGAAIVYGGELHVTTATSGGEGLESKTSVTIAGGRHYFKCYDDCINSSGPIAFNGGITVCQATGNDAVDSNYGKAGAISIGDGIVLAYTTKGSPEEGLDCDNNSYIRITGNGYAISAGGAQGGSSSSSSITGAAQGYAFVTSSIRYAADTYYTLADADGNNLITYSFEAAISSTLGLFTAKDMTKGATYSIKSSTTAPADATESFHGLYLGSTARGTTNVTTFTAK